MQNKIGFSIHPLFYGLAVVMMITGHIYIFLASILAVLLHESAHAIVAKWRGYISKSIVLTPFGAILYSDDHMDKRSEIIVGLAGPIANLVIALGCISIWWVFPNCYDYTYAFVRANIVIAVFNLVPAFPLDGARVIRAFCTNKVQAIRILRRVGIVLSIILMALFITSAFYIINFSLGIMAIFLYLGAELYTDKELRGYVSYRELETKNYRDGIFKQEIIINEYTTLIRVLRLTQPNTLVTFSVVDARGVELCKFNENQLNSFVQLYPLNTTVNKLLS